MTDTADETKRQASAEFDDTPPSDSDVQSDEENDDDEELVGEEDEGDEGVH